MGRADQTTKVKGMFVRPEQVAAVVKRHPEITKARLVVDREDVNDSMTLCCEVSDQSDSLADAIKNSLKEVCKLRGDVKFVASGLKYSCFCRCTQFVFANAFCKFHNL